MNIIIVHIGNIILCPPVINLINIIEELHINCTIITTESSFFNNWNYKFVKFELLNINYENQHSILKKFIYMFKFRNIIWNKISKIYNQDSLIWVTSNVSLKFLGNKILNMNYILQLMELVENLRYYYKLPYFGFDKTKIGNSALAVVVPEYNRAHLVKTWWKLDRLPLILPNKPYLKKYIEKNSSISDINAQNILKTLDKKKIILYQGILHKGERRIENYIKAVDKLGEDYAFVVMSGGNNIYQDIKSKNFYFIPFINSPKHLEVTSHAYIGVLSYFPVKSYSSELNSLYCAPNKTFEYSMFGIPMLGNDIPGLKYIFDVYKAGICVDVSNVDDICNGIRKIEGNYTEMSRGSRKYYDSVNLKEEFKNIIEIVIKRKTKRYNR